MFGRVAKLLSRLSGGTKLADGSQLLVREQIAAAAADLAAARRALAAVIEQYIREKRLQAAASRHVRRLEASAIAAMGRGDKRGTQAARAALGTLDGEIAASSDWLESLDKEAGSLKLAVEVARGRLVELKRGLRIAEIADRIRRMQAVVVSASAGLQDRPDTEETPLRIMRRRQEMGAAAKGFERRPTASGRCPD